MSDLISVIVPIYNSEKYLSECIESIISQTYRHLQLILVDDGSSDSSGAICDRYAEIDSRICVIHKENAGVSAARNSGIDKANGEWIYFIDSDDYIENDTLESAIKTAYKNKSDMCFFDYRKFKGDIRKNIRSIMSNETYFMNTKGDIEKFCIYLSGSSLIWNFIIKSEIIKKIRFDEFYKKGGCEDCVMKFAIYPHINSFSYLNQIKYNYRMVEGSAMHSIREDYIDASLHMYRAEKQLLDNYEYPKDAEKALNSKMIANISGIMRFIINSNASAKKRTEIAYKFICTEEVRNSKKNYFKSLVNRPINLFMMFPQSRLITRIMLFVYKTKSLCSKI